MTALPKPCECRCGDLAAAGFIRGHDMKLQALLYHALFGSEKHPAGQYPNTLVVKAMSIGLR